MSHSSSLQILWIDPFHGGSHAAVSRSYADHSRHQVELLTLSTAGGWRWRMRGGAVTLARMLRELAPDPDLIITTDMLDLATFRTLAGERYARIPTLIYFHENQLTYPLPPGRARDLSFAWINYTSALSAERICFNSAFHRRIFLEALPELLGRFHDYQELQTIEQIATRSAVLEPGIDLASLEAVRPAAPLENPVPLILWNSRWEYDKQPEVFFAALEQLEAWGIAFGLIIAGEHIDPNAPEFAAARERWAGRTIHWGYAGDRADYARLLWQADLVVSTAAQEFFGIAVVEALACGCIPVLPRRLNYPDLLPLDLHDACLYEHDEELAAKLAEVLARRAIPARVDWRGIAAPYAWPERVQHYDDLFCEVVKATGS